MSGSSDRPPPEGLEPERLDSERLDLEEIELEITDVLDLHSFPPKEIAPLVRDWLDLASAKGFRELRIVHGKGIGVQRRVVRSILEKDARVRAFGDAPGDAGGWGATRVELKPR